MKVAGGLMLFVYGLATGVAAVVLHAAGWWPIAWVVVASALLMVFVGPGWLTWLPFALGFGAVVALGAQRRGEGDYLVGTSTQGYVLLGLATLLLVAAIVTLPRPRPRDRGEESS